MMTVAWIVRSTPCGMLLTKILKFLKVPLDGESSVHVSNLFSTQNINQMRIYLVDKPSTKEVVIKLSYSKVTKKIRSPMTPKINVKKMKETIPTT